jgi:hypothetical protein
MLIDEAIDRFQNYHPITKEDEEAFRIAVECMKFTRDFLQLSATPERMKNALYLLNSLEYAMGNKNIKVTFSEDIKD